MALTEARKEYQREYQRRWREANTEKARAISRESARRTRAAMAPDERDAYLTTKRARTLVATYGITVEERDAMLAAQDGVCAICAGPFVGTPHVDHDHDTGAVRGLLCQPCNQAIGFMGDSPRRLIAAALYLERASE